MSTGQPKHLARQGAAATDAVSRNFQWHLLDLRDQAALSGVREAALRIVREDERSTLENDVDWAIASCANPDDIAKIWVCSGQNEIVGIAALTAGKSKLNLELGNWTLASWPVERHQLAGCPVFSGSARNQEDRLTRDLITTIFRSLPRRGVLFVLGSRADSALFDILCDSASQLPCLVLGYGPRYRRRLIQLPDSFDAYIASLSKKTRANVRRLERKLASASIAEIRLSRFVSHEHIDPFLEASIAISRKTYQWKKLGLGLRDRKALTERFKLAADRASLLCYVLFSGDKPIAYQIGYKYNGTFYAHDPGYDPEWSQYSVGNKLDLLILQDLINSEPEVRTVDFLYGDSFNKDRFSNAHREERHFYLFPHSVLGYAEFITLKMANAASEAVGQLLDRFGLKERLRRVLWR